MEQDRARAGADDAGTISVAHRRRGACPTLAAPMATGDGLLVRLRPASGLFSPPAFLQLLDAADTFGNGRLDITARGNLQIRGLRAGGVAHLAGAVRTAGIVPVEGVAIEMPPLAGLDPSEIADPRPLGADLSRRIAAAGLDLAPKLSIVIDGGGQLHLGGVSADLRLTAGRRQDRVLWRFSIAGVARRAIAIAELEEERVAEAVLSVLRRLHMLGPDTRARDLDVEALRHAIVDNCAAGSLVPVAAASSPVGRHALHEGTVLGIAPAFGQMRAEETQRLIEAAMPLGLADIRLAPGRALLLTGLREGAIDAVETLAGRLGFLVDPRDPAGVPDVCAGAAGCASGLIDTQGLARRLIADASPLFDGSAAIHVSGCAKGCARPSPAQVTLVGGASGCGLVVGGMASGTPVAYTSSDTLQAAVQRLGLLVDEAKHGGESAASCLTRLGPARIAAAFQRD